jgi:hypothetical protein
MNVVENIRIDGTKETVWSVITDIDNCKDVISSIIRINVLYKPESELVGLKWEEARVMFGKEATETMWITDAVEGEYYSTRAESHGSVYISTLSVKEDNGGTNLSMSFTGKPQTLIAKSLSFLMAPLIKGSIKKALAKDLQDIKVYVEKANKRLWRQHP